jgi:metal-sulfur cluster biosynthetic enzyme
MGLTSPGCGMGDVLVRDVKDALGKIEGIRAVDAQVVLFPVWNPHTMMSEAAKLKLGLL